MKVLITVVIVLLLLRWLFKPFIRLSVHTTLNKMAEEAQRRQNQSYPPRNEGTISVDYVPNKKENVKGNSVSDKGEYIDYEEVK